MMHARHQEEAHIVLRLLDAALGAVGKVIVEHDRAHGGQRRIAEAVIDDQLLVLGDEAAEFLRIVGIAGTRPAVIEIERSVADREVRGPVEPAGDEIGIALDDEADDVVDEAPGDRLVAVGGGTPRLYRIEVDRRRGLRRQEAGAPEIGAVLAVAAGRLGPHPGSHDSKDAVASGDDLGALRLESEDTLSPSITPRRSAPHAY
jgi:hypothetical protein